MLNRHWFLEDQSPNIALRFCYSLAHSIVFPWRSSQMATQYQMWVVLLYIWPIVILLTYILPPELQPSSSTTKEPSTVQQEQARAICLVHFAFKSAYSIDHSNALTTPHCIDCSKLIKILVDKYQLHTWVFSVDSMMDLMYVYILRPGSWQSTQQKC